MSIEFNMEISIGNMISVVAFVGVGVTAYFNFKSELKTQLSVHQLRLDWIDAAIEDAARELKATAVTNWRLASLEEQVKAMREQLDSRVSHTPVMRK